MKKTVMVREILDGGMARVRIRRETACGETCAGCGSCEGAGLFEAVAVNSAGARAGDIAVVETSGGKLLGAAALAYLVPVILMIALYALGAALWANELYAGILAAAGFACGILLAVLFSKSREKKQLLSITSVIEREE